MEGHKRIAIVQSSYIPWKGYFDLIRSVDAFILLDDVQFTKRDWRSRNRVKTREGLAWLTIPVHTRGRYVQTIRDVTTADKDWAMRHWRTLRSSYAQTPHFRTYADRLEALYQSVPSSLSHINFAFISAICELLNIDTPITWSTDYATRTEASERLLDLCLAAGATRYLSGPSAQAYMDLGLFADAGVKVEFANYEGYPEYPQPHGPFEHAVSVLDLLFCTGPDALSFMKPL